MQSNRLLKVPLNLFSGSRYGHAHGLVAGYVYVKTCHGIKSILQGAQNPYHNSFTNR